MQGTFLILIYSKSVSWIAQLDVLLQLHRMSVFLTIASFFSTGRTNIFSSQVNEISFQSILKMAATTVCLQAAPLNERFWQLVSNFKDT